MTAISYNTATGEISEGGVKVPSEQTTDANHQPVISNEGSGSISIQGGEAVSEHNSYHSVTTSEIPNGLSGEILSTAHTDFGVPTSELTDKTLININGSATTISAAIHMGLLGKDQHGGYYEIDQDEGNTSTEQTTENSRVSLPQETEHAIQTLSNTLSPSSFEGTVNSFINDDYDSLNWESLIGDSDMTPQQLEDAAHSIHDAVSSQASAVIEKQGANPEEVYEWAKENRPDQLRDAIQRHFYGQDTGAYITLTQDYFTTVPPTADLAKRSGYTVKSYPNGKSVITIDGAEYDLTTAARLGLI